ncbi:copper resistance system multicopper oxidase [Methylocaldum sp.]|uniref:copper resistance system multicopper oxidase n=1 Tax=Methylocaldum sp. TaxID=1969727 RepID=UPI002D2BDE6A|nr:copper resistance system multicopper oxidase [Methylocaldum sp.]HYE36909.1 copper resistance system multicopper oxidase [Methylocaldum sp.]
MKKRQVAAFCFALLSALSAQAGTYDLVVGKKAVNLTGRERTSLVVNGSMPAPTLRWREGEEVTLRVTNRLGEPTSIHWHGIVLPYDMDGVPGISFPGIPPGETFTYRFKLGQSGTYWYHGHSAMQEQLGLMGAIIIEPAKGEIQTYDRDYTVILSDWSDENPHRVLSKLKKQSDYYNFQKRTVFDFFRDLSGKGVKETMADRLAWGEMRMDPTDIADVTGYTYTFLVNGQSPEANWTALFKPGERIRLRFINGAAMTHFDVKIPGLKMRVIQADGQNVEPVEVDEFRIAVAETYDVLVEPRENRAYAVFAEAMDRSGYAGATLAPRRGMRAEVPALRPRPLVTLAEMGAAHGMNHGSAAMNHSPEEETGANGHEGHDMAGMDHASMPEMNHSMSPHAGHEGHAMADHGEEPAGTAHRVLTYADLKSATKHADWREPDREIVLRLTGTMNRYIWSINGKKYSEAEPIRLKYGERVRFTYINETMMNHPLHLHGMWQDLDNGKGPFNPRKHVVNVKPGETVHVDVPADAPGEWAFHCHLVYHMETGMFRKIIVEYPDTAAKKGA